MKNKSKWNTLSMQEKAAFIKVGVKNGLTPIQDIENRYNSFYNSIEKK